MSTCARQLKSIGNQRYSGVLRVLTFKLCGSLRQKAFVGVGKGAASVQGVVAWIVPEHCGENAPYLEWASGAVLECRGLTGRRGRRLNWAGSLQGSAGPTGRPLSHRQAVAQQYPKSSQVTTQKCSKQG